MRTRTLVVVGLVVALLVAGVGSFYASTRPDGLVAVAERTGFADSADDSVTADGPLAGYSTKGVDDPRVSGGIAGVAGVALVLLIMGGVVLLVRRRTPSGD